MKPFFLFCLIAVLAGSSPFVLGQGNSEAFKLARQGAAAAKNEEWDQAVDLFRKATELDRKNAPNLASVLQQRATAAMNEQRFQEAITDFDEALKLVSKDAKIYERRAYVLMQLKELDKALEDYSAAIELSPKEPRYYQLRSYIYEVKGDFQKSMADTEQVLKLQKGNAEAQSRKERLQKRLSQGASPSPATASPPQASPAATKAPKPKK